MSEERERCCDQDQGGSHYHCGNCGEVSSMLGHYVAAEGGFTCEAKDHPYRSTILDEIAAREEAAAQEKRAYEALRRRYPRQFDRLLRAEEVKSAASVGVLGSTKETDA